MCVFHYLFYSNALVSFSFFYVEIQAKKYKEENYDSELAEDSDDDFEPDSSSEQTSESDRGGTPAKQSRTLSAKILPSPHPSGYGFRTHTRVDYNEMVYVKIIVFRNFYTTVL